MKPIFIWIFWLLLGFGEETTQKPDLREHKNEAFHVGEKLVYRVHYGIVDAGEAVFEVKERRQIGKRNTLHVVATGRSVGAFNLFYKVNDRYETYIDEDAIVPWLFIRRVNEGGYKINQDYIFNRFKSTVNTGDSIKSILPGAQDILSAVYYARTINFDSAEVNDEFPIDVFMDGEPWVLKIKYLGKETVNNRAGKFRCLKFRPLVQEGRVFEEEDSMTIWITDDKNRIPVRLQAEILIGSIKIDIKEIKGNNSPIAYVD